MIPRRNALPTICLSTQVDRFDIICHPYSFILISSVYSREDRILRTERDGKTRAYSRGLKYRRLPSGLKALVLLAIAASIAAFAVACGDDPSPTPVPVATTAPAPVATTVPEPSARTRSVERRGPKQGLRSERH